MSKSAHIEAKRGAASCATAAALAVFVVGMMAVSERQLIACSCLGMPLQQSVRIADVVFVGRVTAIRAGSLATWPEVEFDIAEVIKGEIVGKTLSLHTPARGGADCSGFDFAVGKEYLVFASGRLSASHQPHSFGVGLCAGTAAVDKWAKSQQRLRETRAVAREQPAAAHRMRDKTFLRETEWNVGRTVWFRTVHRDAERTTPAVQLRLSLLRVREVFVLARDSLFNLAVDVVKTRVRT